MQCEADFQTPFTRWLKYTDLFPSGKLVYELKFTKENSLPFNAVMQHQLAALYTAKHGRLPYKIADVGIARKPCDGFMVAGSDAFIGIMYYVTRGCKEFFLVDIDVFLNEMETSKRRSLTIDRAREIGITCYLK